MPNLTAGMFPIAFSIIACINTSYSRFDESEITNDVGLLVIGAFAHHGPAFYDHEVKRCEAVLKEKPDDFVARNDLGAALTKLEQYEHAEKEFLKNEELHPGKYETASNLGVMYKKTGDFEKAENWIEKALAIKQGGHMGLGDYYLKMIQWRRETAARPELSDLDTSQLKNFLGVRYSEGAAATAAVANREYVITLIKNDMNFSDAYVVLGDICAEEGDLQTALRCYYRAENLDHPNYVAGSRFQGIIDKYRLQSSPTHVLEHDLGRRQLSQELSDGKKWLDSFQALERERLSKDLPVDFASMKIAMDEAGIERPKILAAAYYRGESQGSGSPSGSTVIVAILIVVTILFAIVAAILAAIYFLFKLLTRMNSRRDGDKIPKEKKPPIGVEQTTS